MTTIPQYHRRIYKRTDGHADRQLDLAILRNVTRGRVRAGPSFQLGTLSSRIANLHGACGASTLSPSALVKSYSAERHATQLTTNQPASQSDSTQLKAGNALCGKNKIDEKNHSKMTSFTLILILIFQDQDDLLARLQYQNRTNMSQLVKLQMLQQLLILLLKSALAST